uniref:TNF alpha induced protein 2 n=1 Tax=Pipistrellus kuhlii TaxID=59472 RepID=A0A7J7R4H9_PIPKU|nr:TNF alpha induced protein 2 [Pipistrellus kuhlii]
MLKMMTFQGLPGAEALDFLGSPLRFRTASEAESEASMSEASSEDLVPPPEAPERDEAETSKKKSKGLATVFGLFTKGKKKKGAAGSVEPARKPDATPGPADPLPTVASSTAPRWQVSCSGSTWAASCPPSRSGCWRPRSCPTR